jgi:hypothetical protein
MTREEAISILRKARERSNWLGDPEVVDFVVSTDWDDAPITPTVSLDGSFTKEEFQAIVFFMEEAEARAA